MRATVNGTVQVRAISGTYVVFLAMNMRAADARRLMGFAIQRTDLTADEKVWLRGNKTFAAVRESTGIEDASSHEHPFQAFQWADYSAKPGNQYQSRVIPMSGTPGNLREGQATTVSISTEPLHAGKHDAHFNRGAIASQAFARRFPGLTLDEAGQPAYDWLTRDLLPGLLDFIALAKDNTFRLRAAIYELKWPAVLSAFKEAKRRGADVKIIYHALDDDTGRANEHEIDEAGIRSLVIPRTQAKLMHNKFIVLVKKGASAAQDRPQAVWTGSTNVSRNALFGQLNAGHTIRDAGVAKAFHSYWTALKADPGRDALKDWVGEHNPVPPLDSMEPCAPVFSPHRGQGVFKWWVELASAQARPLFMTFPFGIVKDFRPVFDKNDGVLRFALLDKYVNGGNDQSRQAAIADTDRIRGHPNIGMALGNRIMVDWVDGWHQESDGIGNFVNWVHSKFMLIDPLGDAPVTLTGSTNWSGASVDTNDENHLIIRGDQRVADIYFGEFMRVFAHHRFRESVKRHIEEHGTAAFNSWKPQNLFEDTDEWVPSHFNQGSEKDIKRRYFAGVS